MSNGLPLLTRCQSSIFSCKASRTASSSRFFGARSRMMAASPAQNASGEIPLLGVASLAMKSNRTGAILSPWAGIRFMMGFSRGKRWRDAVFRAKSQKAPDGATFGGLLAPKPGQRKALRLPNTTALAGSNIGSEINGFVEQNAGSCQHPLDLVGRLGNRARRGVDGQLGVGGRLVIAADAGECLQRTGAGLGVMTLGIAALAHCRRR